MLRYTGQDGRIPTRIPENAYVKPTVRSDQQGHKEEDPSSARSAQLVKIEQSVKIEHGQQQSSLTARSIYGQHVTEQPSSTPTTNHDLTSTTTAEKVIVSGLGTMITASAGIVHGILMMLTMNTQATYWAYKTAHLPQISTNDHQMNLYPITIMLTVPHRLNKTDRWVIAAPLPCNGNRTG